MLKSKKKEVSMQWTPETFLLANFILIVSSILQMATGVSVGMIIVPFLAMISYTLVPTPIIFASLVLTMMMSYKGREHIDLHNVSQIAIGMLAGIFVSVFILSNTHVTYLGVLFGVLILISVGISIKVKTFKLTPTKNYLGGLFAGVMGAMAAVGGQILALLFQNHPLESIKATLAFLYTLFSIAMLGIFYYFGQFHYEDMISGFYMMPGFLIGFFISPFFAKYFNAKYSKTVVLSMATLGSLMLIWRSF